MQASKHKWPAEEEEEEVMAAGEGTNLVIVFLLLRGLEDDHTT